MLRNLADLTIKTKLILSLSFLLVTGFFLTNYLNYRVSRHSVRSNIIEHSLPLTRDNIYSEIQTDLLRPIYVSSLMANDTFLKDWAVKGEKDVSQITRYLQEISQKYGFFSTFFVSDQTGNYYHFNGIVKRISPQDAHDVWFYDFKNLNQPYDLSVDNNQAADNHLTIFINHRLEDYQGHLLGVTGVGLNMQMVAELLLDYQKRYDRDVFLVDRNGLVKVHKDQDWVDQVNIFQREGLGEIAGQVLTAGDEPRFFEYRKDGRAILLTSRYIPEFKWFLLVEQDEGRALAGIRNSFLGNLVMDFAIILLILVIIIWTINKYQSRLEQLATTDELTQAFNRREFERCFELAVYQSRRKQGAFSVILFDVDNFKDINDQFGHLAGDRILKEVAVIARECFRKNDLLVRWGGDEFVLLTYGDLRQARSMAERIRFRVQELVPDMAGQKSPEADRRVSISCGVVEWAAGETLDQIMARADRALYLAKNGGRNLTVAVPQGAGAAG